ncbi:PDZ domain-containing protein [Streptomyces sp. AJS327]|uniref:S41 family peptidase n=1 Tax=Streptomyces sp. AJS327 TaxID=2545265 RepID=UPI0015DF1819|nr:S41 family peptidase [Streptomyces sp. AJS327]MBA0049521.1 PDZ domain-containing protein [Streptomyces sp. AJS327]
MQGSCDSASPRRARRAAGLALVFASVLATGAAGGSWRTEPLTAQAKSPSPDRTAHSTTANAPSAAPSSGGGPGPFIPDATPEATPDRGTRDADELVSRNGDRWSGAFSATEYEGLEQSLDGGYTGIGVSVRRVDTADGPAVAAARVRPGGPADRAGVRPGDLLRKVDGRPVADRPVTEIVAWLRGAKPVEPRAPRDSGTPGTTRRAPGAPRNAENGGDAGNAGDAGSTAPRPTRTAPAGPGSTVTLTLARADRTWQRTLHRSRLRADPVTVDRLGPAASRVRITSFTQGTGQRVRRALEREVPAGSGLLLDLRGNSGGLVEEAVEVASALLDGGLVGTYDDEGVQRALYAKPGGDTGRPLAVLVDGGTMSAAELLAGALQDRGRAVVVGSRTFGKGSVQLPRRQPDGSVAQLTVGHYLTPAGRSVEGTGLIPDLPLDGVAGGSDRAVTERARAVLGGLGTPS